MIYEGMKENGGFLDDWETRGLAAREYLKRRPATRWREFLESVARASDALAAREEERPRCCECGKEIVEELEPPPPPKIGGGPVAA